MKKLIAGTLGLLSLCFALQAGNEVAINNVINLQQSGVGNSVIVNYINTKNEIYDLDAADIIRLKGANVTDDIINLMLDHHSDIMAPAPPPPAPITIPSPSDPDVQFFYEQLSPYGSWLQAEGTWYWQPSNLPPGWAPYSTGGYWQYTDAGWYWQSTYTWGWAPFHYGRWWLSPNYGWIWRPDRSWGPSWVIWRNSGDYMGWAPMPPGANITANGYWYQGQQVESSFSFNLTYIQFSFCYANEICSPKPRIYHGDENRDIYRHSAPIPVHITPIENNGHKWYNHGPQLTDLHPKHLDPTQIKFQDAPPKNYPTYTPPIQNNPWKQKTTPTPGSSPQNKDTGNAGQENNWNQNHQQPTPAFPRQSQNLTPNNQPIHQGDRENNASHQPNQPN